MDINEFADSKNNERDALKLVCWFIGNTIDQYLDQNTESVLKNIKNDSIPLEVKSFFYDYELSHKKRGEVLNALR